MAHIPDIEEALNCFPGRGHVVLEVLNAEIGRLRNPCDQQVTNFLASLSLVDLLVQFLQRLCYCNLHMCGRSTMVECCVLSMIMSKGWTSGCLRQ